MDAGTISRIQSSAEAVNQVLKNASNAQVDSAKKMARMNVEMSLASEPGKGEMIDCMA
ncbi:MAG: hypothetical protein JW795_18680 [Chitinivibrionales bacterium]|nr:hypothetical protein [Chitinivibrionales bacterium]